MRQKMGKEGVMGSVTRFTGSVQSEDTGALVPKARQTCREGPKPTASSVSSAESLRAVRSRTPAGRGSVRGQADAAALRAVLHRRNHVRCIDAVPSLPSCWASRQPGGGWATPHLYSRQLPPKLCGHPRRLTRDLGGGDGGALPSQAAPCPACPAAASLGGSDRGPAML